MNEPAIADLFEIPKRITYLNSANMAPQLRSVTAAGLEAVRRKAAHWTLSPADWFAGAEELRMLAGQLWERKRVMWPWCRQSAMELPSRPRM
jgi:hypothetical protein